MNPAQAGAAFCVDHSSPQHSSIRQAIALTGSDDTLACSSSRLHLGRLHQPICSGLIRDKPFSVNPNPPAGHYSDRQQAPLAFRDKSIPAGGPVVRHHCVRFSPLEKQPSSVVHSFRAPPRCHGCGQKHQQGGHSLPHTKLALPVLVLKRQVYRPSSGAPASCRYHENDLPGLICMRGCSKAPAAAGSKAAV